MILRCLPFQQFHRDFWQFWITRKNNEQIQHSNFLYNCHCILVQLHHLTRTAQECKKEEGTFVQLVPHLHLLLQGRPRTLCIVHSASLSKDRECTLADSTLCKHRHRPCIVAKVVQPSESNARPHGLGACMTRSQAPC